MKLFWMGIVLSIIFLQGVQGIHITDDMYFTIEANKTTCADILIPDALGYSSVDKIDYIITSTTTRDWSDVGGGTINTVSTDHDNTHKFPVCFYGIGKEEGDCSDPFVITINSPTLGQTRSFDMGICVSEFSDVDIADIGAGDVADVLSNNVDFFDIGFESNTIYLTPGEQADLKLLLQSYGEFTIDVQLSGMSASPSNMVFTTTSTDPYEEKDFSIQAPSSEGEYEVNVNANIQGCSDSLCAKTAKLTVIVGDQQAPEFTVSIFPLNLNRKDLATVTYRMTIVNNGDAAEFTTNIILPTGITSNFNPSTYTIDSGSRKIVGFTITPQAASDSYEIKVTAALGDEFKEAISHLSVNEMVADVLRQAASSDNVDMNQVNNWVDNYQTTNYGDDVESYRSLQDVFNTDDNENNTNNNTNGHDDEPADFNLWWIVIPVVIIAVVIILFLLMRNKGSEKYFTPEEGRIRPLQTL